MKSALAEILAIGLKRHPGKGKPQAEKEEPLDSVAEACKTLFPKLDPEEAAAALRRAFAACMDEREEEDDEDEDDAE